MSVHFDFTLSDIDAENLFSVIRDVINADLLTILDLMCKETEPLIDMTYEESIRYYRHKTAYLEALCKAIKYTNIYHEDRPDDVADITVVVKEA